MLPVAAEREDYLVPEAVAGEAQTPAAAEDSVLAAEAVETLLNKPVRKLKVAEVEVPEDILVDLDLLEKEVREDVAPEALA